MSPIKVILAALIAAAPLSAPTAQAGWLPNSEDFCDTGWVLQALKIKVDSKYRNYIGKRLFLVDIESPKMSREVTRDEEHSVGRKFCHARAVMNDGQARDMWYLLESNWGFAGTPPLSGLEFCISGLDPWHVYGKNCSTVR
jgi:hypothetical protein